MKRFSLFSALMLSCICIVIGGNNRIIVSKKNFELIVINSQADTLCHFPCAIGINKGDKLKEGDCRTPEGVFTVSHILDSKSWSHDFGDGYGSRKGAYGPIFIRLSVPEHTGIGIHGTCFPESIGTRSTEGCVRLKNEDIVRLVKYLNIGTKVIIEKDM